MGLIQHKLRTRLSTLLLMVCLLIVSQKSFALVGGQPANAAEYPGLVIISYDTPSTLTAFSNCTGIVLEPRRVLTTLDCVYGFSFTFGSPSPLIPANSIFVHPVINGEIGGGFVPTVPPTLIPNVSVNSYVLHPQSESGSYFSPYNLAILYLSADISISPSTLYGGKNKFIGDTATAIGWREEDRSTPNNLPENYFILNQLSFPLVNGNDNILGLCFDDEPLTGTVFCGGYRNTTHYLETHDEGAPLYRSVNGQNTVIGITSRVSLGAADINGVFRYEKFARISAMTDFILAHAPNTKFWNERGVGIAKPVNLTPIIDILLFSD